MTGQRHFFALKAERLKLDRVIQVKRMGDPRSRILHNFDSRCRDISLYLHPGHFVRSEEKACPAMPVKYKRKKAYRNESRINYPSMFARTVVSRWVCLTWRWAGISMGIAGGGGGEVHHCGRGEVGELGL